MHFSKDIAIHSLKTYLTVIFIFDIQVCIKSVYGIRLFIVLLRITTMQNYVINSIKTKNIR